MKHLIAILLMNAVVTAADTPITLMEQEKAGGWITLFDGVSAFGCDDVHLPAGVYQTRVSQGSEPESNSGRPGAQGKAQLYVMGSAYKPSGMTPLFDGKTLAGWKVFDGDPKKKASKFEVTKDGELHVVNGPGDLQTDKQYGDFLLQFDCKTNGTALNSGFFFRCRPNEYQNGYEAQIQNAFKDNDRTKPVDFGTGAIYRRVPARKVVSNDKEWFTMTVLAVGPNLRTWVNGYPVVCWTDDRKPTDNARTGLYNKPGHISIQGHDPTTDILFRNIRIVEIKNP